MAEYEDTEEALAWKAYHKALALAEVAVDEAVRLENIAIAFRDRWARPAQVEKEGE